MNNSNSLALRSPALLALAGALLISFVPLPALQATDAPTTHALADKAPSLPLTAKFEKIETQEGPPYVLKLTNTSKQSVKVSATIYLSVMSHNRDKARQVPAHVIEPGQTWIIDELAALDKVTVNADGFAPLELVVK